MYSLHILRRAVKDIANLPKGYAKLVSEHIDRLGRDPRPSDAKKLKGTTDYSLRVGVYRILYEIDDNARIVTVYRVKHRREVYR
jgi:mRNA interferase RelE/StbE